jgi:pyrroloquinoline quinone biosynthesis protein D
MIPRLLPGVRLRALDGGACVLLVPEGAVTLSATAAAVLESIDGVRSVDDITALLQDRFDADGADVAADVTALLAQFAERGWTALCS